jgi:N-acyl-D-amino-acid deacylase
MHRRRANRKRLLGAAALICLNACHSRLVAPAPPPRDMVQASQFDVIIKNGTVYDGSGAPGVRADVGIVGHKIVAVANLSTASAARVIDAGGKIVTPGFINTLSWANESLIHDGRGLSDVVQGITLEIFGEGWSAGPLTAAMKADLLAEMTDENRYAIRWTSLRQFLDYLQTKGVTPNVASFVGAATVRMHELGSANRAPSPAELARMTALVDTAMREGALGVGSALIYAPGTYANTEELIALASVAGRYGGSYISHMRSEGARFLESLDELLHITQASGVHGEIYHLKAAGAANWPKMQLAIDKINAARAKGVDVGANMYTYTAGATGLDAAMPTWVQEGGFEAWRARLLEPATRARVLREMRAPDAGFENLRLAAGDPKNVLFTGFKTPSLRHYIGKTLAEVAAQRNSTPEDTVIDLVIEDHSRVETAYFLMSESNVQLGLAQPWVGLGSDGEALAPEGNALKSNPHPRAYGNVARFWQRYVVQGKLMSTAQAVHRLTGLPATNFHLAGRGCLRIGCFADIAVFAPENIAEHATFAAPHALSTGIDFVLVNGTVVVEDGKHNGATPGQAVLREWVKAP